MTPRSTRLLASTTFAALFTVLAFGCAANAPEAEPGTTSDALITKCAPGFSPTDCQTCGPEDGCRPAKTWCTCEADPAPPPPSTCLANPICTSYPKTTPHFDPVSLGVNKGYDTSFADQLAAAGCAPERSYDQVIDHGAGISWATAICPDTFTLSSAVAAAGTAGTLSCDSCTGTPGAHQVVIAWLVSPGPGGDCKPPKCNPDNGCAGIACLRQDQRDESDDPGGPH